MKRNKFHLLIALLFFTVMGFQNCGSFEAANHHDGSRQSSMDLSSSAKFSCQFIGVEALRSRLSVVLGLDDKDVPVLSENGSPTSMGRIESTKSDLGAGDLSQDKYDDFNCGMSKYKASIEVMVDACAWAMADSEVRSRLFPEGLANMNSLYFYFIGREPTSAEIDTLNQVKTSLPNEKQAAGLCAIVASSMESLIRI